LHDIQYHEEKTKPFSKVWARQFLAALERKSGRGKKYIGKSIEIKKTNIITKIYPKNFQKYGRRSFEKQFLFKSIEINKTNKNIKIYQHSFKKFGRGSTTLSFVFVSRICMLNLNLLAVIVPEISTFIRT